MSEICIGRIPGLKSGLRMLLTSVARASARERHGAPRLPGPFPANPHLFAWTYAWDLNWEDSRTAVRAMGSATCSPGAAQASVQRSKKRSRLMAMRAARLWGKSNSFSR